MSYFSFVNQSNEFRLVKQSNPIDYLVIISFIIRPNSIRPNNLFRYNRLNKIIFPLSDIVTQNKSEWNGNINFHNTKGI